MKRRRIDHDDVDSTAADGKQRPNAVKGSFDGSCADAISFPCLSFRQPFGSLLLNGAKTIESRWLPYLQDAGHGVLVAVHIAYREWEDPDAVLEAVVAAGAAETLADAQELCLLPDPFTVNSARQSAVGVFRIGRTWHQAGPDETFERCNLAPVAEKYLASVDEVSWFKRPVPVRASKGLFRIVVPSDVLADDLRCSLQEIVTEDNTRGEDGTGLAECSAASLTSHMFRKDEGELAARDSPCRR